MKYIPYLHLSNAIEKRCPNGYHKNPKTGQCEPKGQKGTASTSTGCQEGFHQHAGYKNCHEIWKPHKAHTLSCNQHRLLGIPCRYKGEVLDENGKPVEKGIPTREWLKQAKEKKEKEKKDEKPKEESIVGLPKHPMVNKTRNMAMDVCKRIEGFEDMSNSVNEVFDKFDESDEEYSGANLLKKAFNKETIPWFRGIDVGKVETDTINKCIPDFKKVISEYPLGLTMFTRLSDKDYYEHTSGSIMGCYSSSIYDEQGLVFFGRPLHGTPSKSAPNREQYELIVDPKTKIVEKWGFHHQGSNYFDSFSHEYGHLMFRIFGTLKFALSDNLSDVETTESKKKREDAWREEATEISDKIKDIFSEYSGDILIPKFNMTASDSYRGEFTFTIYSVTEEKLTKQIKEFRKFLKTKGYNLKTMDYNGTCDFTIKCVDSKNKAWHTSHAEIPSFADEYSMNELRKIYRTPRDDKDNDIAKHYKDFIEEVESLYLELYKQEKIIPSEVYSGYGYLGNGDEWGLTSVPNKRLSRDNSHERIAEAFSDVIVRGDKANSMSNLLVSGIQYYIGALLNGNLKSFTEYMRENYTPETIGERIIKHRYINP